MYKHLIGVLISTLSITTFASNFSANSDLYIGMGYGQHSFTDTDSKNISAKVYIGQNISPYFSIEGGLEYLGDSYAQIFATTQIGYPYYYIYPYIKLGGTLWANTKQMDTGVTPLYGLGLGFRLNKEFIFKVEYQQAPFLDNHSSNSISIFTLNWTLPSQSIFREKAVNLESSNIESSKQIIKTEKKDLYPAYVFFGHDSSTISDIGMIPAVSYMLTHLNKNSKARIKIDGFTNSIGSSHYNLNLSKERAQKVAEWFYKKGISKSRIDVTGHGQLAITELPKHKITTASYRQVKVTLLNN